MANKLSREEEIILPRETMYLIDKVVRKRVKDGNLEESFEQGLLEEFDKTNQRYNVTELNIRLENQKRKLENLTTPAKKRPKSAVRTNASSVPAKKPVSKLAKMERYSKSEEKKKSTQRLNSAKLTHDTWMARKKIEQNMRTFLINEEKK